MGKEVFGGRKGVGVISLELLRLSGFKFLCPICEELGEAGFVWLSINGGMHPFYYGAPPPSRALAKPARHFFLIFLSTYSSIYTGISAQLTDAGYIHSE